MFIIGGLGEYATLEKALNNILFKQEAVAAPPPRVTFTFFLILSTLLEDAFIRNIILLCINDIC